VWRDKTFKKENYLVCDTGGLLSGKLIQPKHSFVWQWHGWYRIQNRDSNGNLYVRYLNWNGDRWNWNFNWLDNDFNGDNPAAVPATYFISLPYRESFVVARYNYKILL